MIINKTMEQVIAELPESIKNLVPQKNIRYYELTNQMHCDISKPGGSKFTEINNILDVLIRDAERISTGVVRRIDDRKLFLDLGVSEQVFLPATNLPDQPIYLPEALYFKVDGFKGRVGVIQLQNLDFGTKIIVRREKSIIDEKTGKEKIPCSFSVVKKSLDDMPEVDFATVIIGREGGETGVNELLTIHPGAPIKASVGDFIAGSELLLAPKEGEKQQMMVITVEDLLMTGKMMKNDYVKIIRGDKSQIFV